MPVLHINEDEVRQAITMPQAIDAVEAGFRKMGLDEAFTIPRTRCQTDHTVLHISSGAAKSLGVVGYKAYTTNRRGAKFHVCLYDGKTGEMLAWIQGDYLGQIRTGAASGVATKVLSRPESSKVGIFGAGKQARTQLEAMTVVRPITEAFVYSRTESSRNGYASEMSERLKIMVTPVDHPRFAAVGMDIICTATTASEPVLLGEWLSPGQHLNITGSNFLAKAEIDSNVVRRADLITIDNKDQGIQEAGDFSQAISDHILHWNEVKDLSRFVSGRDEGRQSEEQITLFKSLGLGIGAVVVAGQVYKNAKELGLGRLIDL
jgi:alanine dehydrogenase